MVNSFKLFVEKFEDRQKPQLHYAAFDWDDNILFMSTLIHMQEMVGDDWVAKDVSTSKFVTVRKQEGWRILNNNMDEAFSEFKDNGPRGNTGFLEDTKDSIKKKKFGPSWDDFIECLTNGNIFAIITARGHEPDTIKEACKWIIMNLLSEDQKTEMGANLTGYLSAFEDADLLEERSFDELIDKYLTYCDFYGITSKFFEKIYPGAATEPEEAKKAGLKLFANKIAKFGDQLGADVHLGFSDDDPGNVEEVTKLFRDELSLIHAMEYYVFDTSNKDIQRVQFEHVMTYESFSINEDRNEIVIIDRGRPTIAYKNDVESDKLGLMDGYMTGTVIIGNEMSEDKGVTDFSSPFHTGQVTMDEHDMDTEEMDFSYHKSISGDTVRAYLDDYVSDAYNNSMITKMYYH